jgi:hypothetical protein
VHTVPLDGATVLGQQAALALGEAGHHRVQRPAELPPVVIHPHVTEVGWQPTNPPTPPIPLFFPPRPVASLNGGVQCT